MTFLVGCVTGNRVSVPGALSLVESHELQVYGDRGDWQKAGYAVKRGDFVMIKATGRWSAGPGATSDAEGHAFWTAFNWVIPPLGCLFLPKASSPLGCLVAEFENGQRVAVGRVYSVANPDDYYSGSIYFKMNDCLFANNGGVLGVQIEVYRMATPPVEAPVPAPTPPLASISDSPATIRSVHVLVIGIASYQDSNIPKLNCTLLDARAVYEFFRSAENSPARASNVHLLSDHPNDDGLRADKRGMMLAINRYLVKKAVHKDDMAILYFAGHGDVGKHPTKGTEYYLLPSDAEMSDLFVTAIELREFQRLWNAIPAGTKLLIADACNSGGFSGLRGPGGVTGVESMGGEAKAVFSACKSNQSSMEVSQLGHGLFTYVLLGGLKGKADMVCGDNDGRVTLAELKRWLDKQVPLEARRMGGNQTPITSLVDAWGEVYLTR